MLPLVRSDSLTNVAGVRPRELHRRSV